MASKIDMTFKATELRLGLPGRDDEREEQSESSLVVRSNKRASPEISLESAVSVSKSSDLDLTPAPAKAQVVGWPPIRSYRKNSFQKKTESELAGVFVKVSMDGAPFLRKIDLNVYKSYSDLLKALEIMFKFAIGEYSENEGYRGSDYVPTYEDKDGDWMLVGDVPWNMFISSCKRMRIMKGSEARGLGCA